MKSLRILLIIATSLLFKLAPGQIDSSDYKANSFYLYKTEEDFFAKNKNYRGQYFPSDRKVIKYQTSDSKKKKLSLDDSCTHYFGYQIGDEIQIRPNKKSIENIYYVFGGGTIDAYCVVYGELPNYDKQGYLLGLTAPGGRFYMYFNNRTNNVNMAQIEEFLKSKPKLLKKYQSEKKEMDKELWERNKLSVGIKYLKLFIAEK